MCAKYDGLTCHQLSEAHTFFAGRLPTGLVLDREQFESLWNLHPDHYHEIMIHGRPVLTPRFQQAYGFDYHYTGTVNQALPVPSVLNPHLEWCRKTIDARLNGILVNWYDGRLGHYIGHHRDSTKNMVNGAPIVTISLGEDRIFRLRPWKGPGYTDFQASDGSVFVMPYATNHEWTHEVPHFERFQGRRVSVTARAFNQT